MARQKGAFPLSGRIGDVIFYQSPHGSLARAVGSLNKKRIATDPAFAATRATGTEFGRVSRAGKLLRDAVRPYAPFAREFSTNYRLNKVLNEALQRERVHERGDRLLSHTDLSGLAGFEWNSRAAFFQAFGTTAQLHIDRATGLLQAELPAFQAGAAIRYPDGASHCRLMLIGLAPDFDRHQCTTAMAESALWTPEEAVPAHRLACSLPPATVLPLLGCLGIRFFQEVNGKLNPLKGGDGLVVGKVDR